MRGKGKTGESLTLYTLQTKLEYHTGRSSWKINCNKNKKEKSAHLGWRRLNYHYGIWKFLMSIIKIYGHFRNPMRENFLAIGPIGISPNTLRNFTQTKTKKKSTSHESKGIWASHGKAKDVVTPGNREQEGLVLSMIKGKT